MKGSTQEGQLFLLGGYDLEMICIKDLLLERGFSEVTSHLELPNSKCFRDKKLSWGARLSAYSDLLSYRGRVYGIELSEDITPPQNYVRIDHHNELAHLPASIEQVAQILGIQLTRQQMLVAANDKGYIPAMVAMNASEEEIAKTRRADRQAQGVTERDEQLAEESISQQSHQEQGITIVKSLSDKFSPVTDKLYGKTEKFLIYTDKELVFYGKGVERLTAYFAQLIKERKAYSGGGENGYFGLVEGVFDKEGIKRKLINIIKVLQSMNNSYHIFLFPFKWKFNQTENKNNTALFSELVNLEIANDLIMQDKKRWDIDLYNNFKDHEDYNEFVYFYPFVRNVLYDYQNEPNRNTLIRHYTFLPAAAKQLKYVITIENKKLYQLNVESILLNLYKTGVGVLSFHLKNDYPTQQEWNDILSINEYGRRLYPQFLSHGFSMDYTKAKILADSIEIINTGISPIEGFPIKEDFEEKTGLTSVNDKTKPDELDLVPNHIDKILPKHFRDAICIEPIIDDRMFVVSTYLDEENNFSHRIKNLKEDADGRLVSKFNAELYKYIFLDGPESGGVGNNNFRDDLLKKHTYSRWIGEATFFGVSRYSFVSYSNFFLIPVHTRTMYYKMAELCLIQRASVLTFTEEVSRISKLYESPKLLTDQLDDLYKNYIQFVNKIYFREVTAQEQGIELYDLIQEKMGLRAEVESLDREIEELHNYVMLLEEKGRNKQLETLNIQSHNLSQNSYKISLYGLPLLIMSIITGILSIPIWDKNNFPLKEFSRYPLAVPQILWVTAIVIVPGLITFSIIYFSNRKSKH